MPTTPAEAFARRYTLDAEEDPEPFSRQRPVEYTLRLSRDESAAQDALKHTVRERVGRSVSSAEVLRALIAEAADDEQLLQRVTARLTDDQDTVPFGSSLPAELHRQFTATCAEQDIETQHALAAAIRAWLAARA